MQYKSLSSFVMIFVISRVLRFAFKLCPFASCLCVNSRDCPDFLLDFLPGFGLCFSYFASCFELFDLQTSTFLGSCPSVELLFWFIDCCNSVTQRWHQLLAGFRFEAAEPLFKFKLAEIAHGIFARLLSWLQIVYEAHTCDERAKLRQLKSGDKYSGFVREWRMETRMTHELPWFEIFNQIAYRFRTIGPSSVLCR